MTTIGNVFVQGLNEFTSDQREMRGGWGKGFYTCSCSNCGKGFMGGKRAWCCAPCAYGDESPEIVLKS